MSTTMVAFLLYLFTRVGTWSSVISGWTVFLTIVMGLTLVIYLVWFAISQDEWGYDKERIQWHEDQRAKLRRVMLYFVFPVWLLLGTTSLLLPNQKDMMLIVGGALGYHGINAIVSDERVQETGGKAFELMNVWLDQQIDQQRERTTSTSESEGE